MIPTSNPYISTFKSYIVDDLKISMDTVDNYNSNDINMKNDSRKKIINTTLKNLNYSKWLPYEEYIELKLYENKVVPNNSNLIVVLNLSKDVSVMAIYNKVNGEYVYMYSIEDILPVKGLEFRPYPHRDYNLIISHQKLDERLGAFYYDEFLELWGFNDGSFKELFRKTTYSEEIYNLNWVDPDEPKNKWKKNIKVSFVDFPSDKSITTRTTIESYLALSDVFPSSDKFEFLGKSSSTENYIWDENSNKYISTDKKTSTLLLPVDFFGEFSSINDENYKIVNTN
ncbi:MAG: hypothetical protein N4A57_03665 [Anaeromicrobium sp.]|jgi:hypothetical protein|uniref:hypothetical protein n=1 Tax=Anaeromicrobium sp. TaxID=1929132 RepID=UPI0025E79B87|nr:hypothetical protein [Anaeromicrobium sp.]MCT4593356.1 hypothetical protein [Anaeromicrobium sp.]